MKFDLKPKETLTSMQELGEAGEAGEGVLVLLQPFPISSQASAPSSVLLGETRQFLTVLAGACVWASVHACLIRFLWSPRILLIVFCSRKFICFKSECISTKVYRERMK